MRRIGFGVLVLAGLAVGVSWGTTVNEENKPIKEIVLPHSSDIFALGFREGDPAAAIVVGDGRSFLGLYVYDSFSNCIALDDLNQSKARDDLAVVWYPPRTDRYYVEIVNFGRQLNQYELGMK